MPGAININDYTYALPTDRIALFPLRKRDQSKLLLYNKGEISHHTFGSLPDFIPNDSLIFFNDTKVIPARLRFKKDTGAEIEIFLLSPVAPTVLFAEAMQTHECCSWKCTIGNLKRWSDGALLKKNINGTTLSATLLDREEGVVEFLWTSGGSFAELIHSAGETPLPPYLKRKPEVSDKERYQTVYAHLDGAVAAPTAGLHFTPDVIEQLKAKGAQIEYLTLHVSAGTFQPVKVYNAAEHVMHKEQILVTRGNLERLLQPDKKVVAVGTTSMRTLESIYWFGAKLSVDPLAVFSISQNDPYDFPIEAPSKENAILQVIEYMKRHELDVLNGETSIFIMPGYSFRVCDALVTNFHQPGSTLILLVAAFAGEDWKKIYDEALKGDYRFLSYGDSSLILPR